MKQITAVILNELDHVAINEHLRSQPCDEAVYDLAMDMALRAVDRYLVDDLTNYDRCEVELQWRNEKPKLSGTFDLVLWGGKVGTPRIDDWKTTVADTIPPNYEDEHRESWQTYMYGSYGADWMAEQGLPRPEIMGYRVITPKAVRGFSFKTEPERYKRLIDVQAEAIERAYMALETVPVWPKTLPYPCHSKSRGGATCPYWEDCTQGTTPLVQIGQDAFFNGLPMRKSHFGLFLECNERYRRSVVLGEQHGTKYELSVGAAFGRIVEEVWRQAFRKKGEL